VSWFSLDFGVLLFTYLFIRCLVARCCFVSDTWQWSSEASLDPHVCKFVWRVISWMASRSDGPRNCTL